MCKEQNFQLRNQLVNKKNRGKWNGTTNTCDQLHEALPFVRLVVVQLPEQFTNFIYMEVQNHAGKYPPLYQILKT